ncbi:MAG: cytochrome c, partial [Acetobacteraceae bacterium]|nr:cytochrome c [Acetobacteraceae bacterium]
MRASLGAAALITLLGPSALAQPAPSTSPTSPAAQPSPAQAQTAWFSDAQASAARGDYATACAACHSGTLGGGSAPALKGAGFLRKWSGRSLRDLWQEVHTLMPLTAPGSMTETQSLGLMALILQDNGFPSGEGALQTASLDRTITPPATAGQPPPVVAGKPP